jgi:hypothetical protein
MKAYWFIANVRNWSKADIGRQYRNGSKADLAA